MADARVVVAWPPVPGLAAVGGAGAAAVSTPAARGLAGADAAVLCLFIEALDYVEPGLVRIVGAILDAQTFGPEACAFAAAHYCSWGDAEWYLDCALLGDDDCGILANVLRVNTALKELDLTGTPIMDDGADELAAALRENTVLEKLSLGGNEITDDGAGQLAAALRGNAALQKLDLGGNEITDDGAGAARRGPAREHGAQGAGPQGQPDHGRRRGRARLGTAF